MSLFRQLALASALVALPGLAHAQRGGGRDEQEVERLLDEAKAAYDNLELDQADSALAQAVQLGQRAGIRGRTMAEIHIQRGIIAHVRDKDKDRAIDEFKQALIMDRTARLDSLVSTPSLEALFDTARQRVGGDRDGGSAGGDDAGLIHKPLKRARANEILAVQVKVAPDLRERMYRVYLYFRSQKTDAVTRIQMKDQGDSTYVARIAAKFVRGKSLGYYILAEDREGNQIAQVHGAQDPIEVPIDDFATGESLNGEEGGEDTGDSSDDSGGDDSAPRSHRVVSIGFALGTGAGRITANAQQVIQKGESKISPGFGWSPFHTLTELDFWLTPRVALGGFARIQIADFAHLEGGRVKFEAYKGGASHIMLRGGGGYGHAAHQVKLNHDDGTSYLDYTLEGPFFYTLGMTWAYDFTKLFALTITPDFYHLIGPSPSQHFDVSVGGQFSF